MVAVSPGLIPQTGLSRYGAVSVSMSMPDAKSVPEGKPCLGVLLRVCYISDKSLMEPFFTGVQSILRALIRDDFPDDLEQIFLASWGEWWGKDMYERTLDKELQDRWCPSREDIEKEAGITE